MFGLPTAKVGVVNAAGSNAPPARPAPAVSKARRETPFRS